MLKGPIRKVDDMGRVIIPKGIRTALSIDFNDPLEIVVEKRSGKTVVILKKYNPGCAFGSSIDDHC